MNKRYIAAFLNSLKCIWAPLTFQPAADGKTYTSDFAVIVRFLDRDNHVTRKVSQHYEVNGPIGQIESARQGDVIFYREPELPAGTYTMQTVVYDLPSGKSSVRLGTVEVTRDDPAKLRMSILVIVKRGEKVPEKDRRAGNPLLVRDVVVSPNLGDAVSKAAMEVGFYFAAYPAQGGPAPESVIELCRTANPSPRFRWRFPPPMPQAASRRRHGRTRGRPDGSLHRQHVDGDAELLLARADDDAVDRRRRRSLGRWRE